jgi:hypothetical protein
VAERDQRVAAGDRRELSEATSRDVLEEDPLDRLLRTELQDLLERRVDEPFVRDEARL